ncbi:hemicentin-2-like isoform X1 [Eriocheir sinensis]|uniref:hemicentin-2-like isoform X1 n=1 Tax=Eriocheir sinensis TaxID=95602 RepID=UPI0021C84D36|nr:hemicentin-2-like isoform X1 [Eriocheir sinensis]
MTPGRPLLVACCLLAVAGWCAGVPMQGRQQEEKQEAQEEKQAEGVKGQPKITYSKATVTKEGDRVRLDCAVEGVDLSGVNDFTVSWSKIDTENPVNSMPISSAARILLFSNKYELDHPAASQRYSLIIKSMNAEDEGLYRCTVDFGDSQRINADVPVSLRAAPYFTDDFTKTLTVTEGDSISIDCQPGGSPRPDVYWEKVNDELPYFGGRFFKSNQLDLPLVQKDHRGHYVCYADNGIGEPATSRVQLEVQYAPDVTLPASRVFTTTNEEVKLECVVSSFPSADVAWYKEGDAILGGANIRILTEDLQEGQGVRSTLTVMTVTPDDLGEYSCRAANTVGKTEKTVQLTTRSPPIIVKQSRSEVLYDLEKSRSRSALPLILDCEAEGAPTPNYRWTKDGEVLVWQADPRLSLEEDTGSLIISQPGLEDNGMYQCFAYNDLGTAAADPVYLLNVSSIHFSNDNEPSDTYHLVAELGRPYKLSCPKAFAYPEPSLTWVRASETNESIALEFVKDERVVTDPDGDLWFTHVTEEDDTAKHEFQFMCLANTPFDPFDYSIASIVNVAVKNPADGADNLKEDMINVESFLMYTSGENVTFMAGEENTLWCIYGGEPVPSIVWRRADGEVMEPNTRVTTRNYGRTLVFADTQLEDAGEYECVATNGVGPEKSSVTRVEVEQRPVLQEPLASQTVREGDTVTFTCETNSTGDVTYTWMLNGRRLSPRDRHLRRTIEGPRLVIAGASTTDVGNYACNASSPLGYAYGQAILNVLPAEKVGGGASCAGVQGLLAELATLRETVSELRVMLAGQEDLALQTHAALAALTEQLAATRTSTPWQGEEKEQEEEEEEEETANTTTSPA